MDTLDFEPWIGKVEETEDRVAASAAHGLAATLDMDAPARQAADLREGGALPPLWHWLGFLPHVPMSDLGVDGHPRRGSFLPPVPLERRMWAGGRVNFFDPLRIGETIHRRSELTTISAKQGTTGRMVFVTVEHRLSSARGLAVVEQQDIVYVAMPVRFVPPPPVAPPEATAWSEAVAMDTVRLFRFSAATFNAHRIHYDRAYASNVEKYPGLVVHGPLQAILLMQAARRHRGGARPAAFRFRGLRPLFDFDAPRLVGCPEVENAQDLFTVTHEDLVCMQARITWSG